MGLSVGRILGLTGEILPVMMHVCPKSEQRNCQESFAICHEFLHGGNAHVMIFRLDHIVVIVEPGNLINKQTEIFLEIFLK